MKKILIVDDDEQLRLNLSLVLKEAGYQTDIASSANEALKLLENGAFDVVLLDDMMPKMSGMDALPTIRRVHPKTKVIMITAFATVENAVDAIKKGASDYVVKPFKIDALLATIGRVLEEAKFEVSLQKGNFDHALSSLTNPIRRLIMKRLAVSDGMHLMEITRELGIDDHTKVVFHLRLLKEAGMIRQDQERSYFLAKEGYRVLECLKTLEGYLQL